MQWFDLMLILAQLFYCLMYPCWGVNSMVFLKFVMMNNSRFPIRIQLNFKVHISQYLSYNIRAQKNGLEFRTNTNFAVLIN